MLLEPRLGRIHHRQPAQRRLHVVQLRGDAVRDAVHPESRVGPLRRFRRVPPAVAAESGPDRELRPLEARHGQPHGDQPIQPLLRRLEHAVEPRVRAEQHRVRLSVEPVLHQQLVQRCRARTTSWRTASRSTRISLTRSFPRMRTSRRTGTRARSTCFSGSTSSCEPRSRPVHGGAPSARLRRGGIRRRGAHARAAGPAFGVAWAAPARCAPTAFAPAGIVRAPAGVRGPLLVLSGAGLSNMSRAVLPWMRAHMRGPQAARAGNVVMLQGVRRARLQRRLLRARPLRVGAGDPHPAVRIARRRSTRSRGTSTGPTRCSSRAATSRTIPPGKATRSSPRCGGSTRAAGSSAEGARGSRSKARWCTTPRRPTASCRTTRIWQRRSPCVSRSRPRSASRRICSTGRRCARRSPTRTSSKRDRFGRLVAFLARIERGRLGPTPFFGLGVDQGSVVLVDADGTATLRTQKQGPGRVPRADERAARAAPRRSASRRGGRRPRRARRRNVRSRAASDERAVAAHRRRRRSHAVRPPRSVSLTRVRERRSQPFRTGLLARAVSAALGSLAAAGMLAACARGERTVPAQTLRLGMTSEPSSLSPLFALDDYTNVLDRLVFDVLITADASGNRLVPRLAREVPSVANGGIGNGGLTLTYRLRRNVRWQDGAPFTSRDVAFSYAAIMNPANNVPNRHGYDQIASVSTPDPYTVVFHMKRPYAAGADDALQRQRAEPDLARASARAIPRSESRRVQRAARRHRAVRGRALGPRPVRRAGRERPLLPGQAEGAPDQRPLRARREHARQRDAHARARRLRRDVGQRVRPNERHAGGHGRAYADARRIERADQHEPSRAARRARPPRDRGGDRQGGDRAQLRLRRRHPRDRRPAVVHVGLRSCGALACVRSGRGTSSPSRRRLDPVGARRRRKSRPCAQPHLRVRTKQRRGAA